MAALDGIPVDQFLLPVFIRLIKKIWDNRSISILFPRRTVNHKYPP